MIGLVAICVECGLDLVVARTDLDLDHISKKIIFFFLPMIGSDYPQIH